MEIEEAAIPPQRAMGPSTAAGIPDLCEEMYKAVSRGDLAACEALLARDESLAWRELSEEGKKALHLAVLSKHEELARVMMRRLTADQIVSHDGHGYTACCYAAMGNMVELLRSLVEAYPALLKLRSWYGTDPCRLAVEKGSTQVIAYFVSLDDWTEAEWLEMLVLSIDNKTFDVALAIVEKRENLAEMKLDDGRTPLHVLAQLDISAGWKVADEEKMQNELKLLTETLWAKIQHLGRDRLGELITNPRLLHDAVKMGNLHLVTMILGGYPHLLFRVDADGHSLLHTIVTSRRKNMLPLVERAREAKILDRDKNNLLHYAGMLVDTDVDLRRAYNWFVSVRMVVLSEYDEMRNKKGELPIELFWKEHGKLLEKIEARTRKSAASCLIIATVVLGLIMTAAFAPPGGYDPTGVPVLVHHPGFLSLMLFKMMGLCCCYAGTLGLFLVLILWQGEYYRAFVMPDFLRYSILALLPTLTLAACSFLANFYLSFLKAKSATFTRAVFLPGVLFVGLVGAGFMFWLQKQVVEDIYPPGTSWRGSGSRGRWRWW